MPQSFCSLHTVSQTAHAPASNLNGSAASETTTDTAFKDSGFSHQPEDRQMPDRPRKRCPPDRNLWLSMTAGGFAHETESPAKVPHQFIPHAAEMP